MESHLRDYHQDIKLPDADSVAVSCKRPPQVGGGSSGSAAKRQKADADLAAELETIDVVDLTEGEYAVPDKYKRDPLGMGR
jgi:hypothetical protein